MDFDQAFDRLLGFEGGYVNDARDAGGETRWGISRRAFPDVDIKTLTREAAAAIYRREFWDQVQAERLPPGLRYVCFDTAVHAGQAQAVRWLQRAVDELQDGKLGPLTLLAALQSPVDRTRGRILGYRLEAMTGLSSWPAFSRGWARRIAALMQD